jgi:hypothetical protein
MKNKNNKPQTIEENFQEDYPMAPPETHFLADRYVVKLPISDPHFESPWELRLHVAKLLKHHIGDEVELTSMKVKKPHLQCAYLIVGGLTTTDGGFRALRKICWTWARNGLGNNWPSLL